MSAHPNFILNQDKLLQSIIDVLCAIDSQGIFRYVSASSLQLFGYTPEEMTGKSIAQFVYDADLEKTVQSMENPEPDCHTSNFMNRYIRKDGSVVHIVWSARWDENDGLFYCVAHDGTERHLNEERLFRAQQMARIANFEYNYQQQDFTYTSDNLFAIFGIEQMDCKKFTMDLFFSLVHPDDIEIVKKAILFPQKTNSFSLDFKMVNPNGDLLYINGLWKIIIDAQGNPFHIIGTLQDITKRKKTEIALKESEERFRYLVQYGNDIIGIIDSSAKYIFVGENVKFLLGHTSDSLIGQNAFQFIHPDDQEWVAAKLQIVPGHKTMPVGPFRFKNGDGEWRWIETTVSNHLDNPNIGGLVVNSKDVTEKKLKEDHLKSSEQKFKSLVQNGSDMIVIIDDQWHFSYVSENVNSILGYNIKDLIGKNVLQFFHPDDVANITEEINNVTPEYNSLKAVPHRFLHKNGSWVWLESRASNHHHNQSIKGLLVNARYVDDRINLQNTLNRELLNKQKEITSAVIKAQEAERSQIGRELHDNVNQILTTVKLYNEMYLSGYVQDKELLVRSTRYTQDCIDEIRSISKRLSAPTLGKISLRDSIKELIYSINLTKRIEINYVHSGIDNFPISEDLHLAIYRIVQEGVNNIIKYAQAKTAMVIIDKKETTLELKILDNGKGFDTKASRTGIGITNMKTRAENLNASFKITSSPGKGCTIVIIFPIEGE